VRLHLSLSLSASLPIPVPNLKIAPITFDFKIPCHSAHSPSIHAHSARSLRYASLGKDHAADPAAWDLKADLKRLKEQQAFAAFERQAANQQKIATRAARDGFDGGRSRRRRRRRGGEDGFGDDGGGADGGKVTTEGLAALNAQLDAQLKGSTGSGGGGGEKKAWRPRGASDTEKLLAMRGSWEWRHREVLRPAIRALDGR